MDGNVTLGRNQAFTFENYKHGARIWHRHPEFVWIAGALLEDIKVGSQRARIQLDDENVVEIPIKGPESLPFLRNPDILIGVDDLTTLSYLHEPAVLHNLKFRFTQRNNVYTYCGIVLVAINPYANCGHLYSDDVIQVYRGVGKQVRELDPHIYAVAEEAYFDLCEYQKNQSIIVSGESGAGKTVSAKHVMRYLATVAGGNQGFGGIEERVLASNPIMEAIGNAKTIRNDNSSRFGKFIQINFGDRNEIVGAEMKTYLLEKSRLVFQAQNERNYHVFYQMCANFDHVLLRPWNLKSADAYFYTNQGRNIYVDEVDDRSEFEQTVQALDLLGFTVVEQSELFRVLAGVLLLGNVDFEGDEGSTILDKSASDLKHLCQELLLVKEGELRRWLTHREIRAINEIVVKPLTREESLRNRDALAKMIYSNIFNWVVSKINVSLARKEKSKKRQSDHFIGVLDIYGFETFKTNSFEQFCINYANEKLQQQFNQHVFKLEQEEYEREELSWVRIDFYDNQPCIELIEGRPGLIEYLDEQCKIVKGSDPGWLDQITNCPRLKKQEHLQMPKIKASSFMIRHFAADVSYQIDGFVEKNKDSVNTQLLEVMAQTKSAFLKEIIASSIEEPSVNGRKAGVIKKTVAGQFRDSLKELMTVLQATRPHYVRCIKPNDEKEEFFYEPKRAIQQLRACGVLETVRISAAGYPSRWLYEDFGKRYRVLYPSGTSLLRTKNGCKEFAQKACSRSLEEDKFALGKTKIFFRTGQVALLERLRHETLARSATRIQAAWKGYMARKNYEKMRAALLLIQASLRAFLAHRRLHYLQMHRAAICLQKNWRRHITEKRYKNLRQTVLALQSAYRANIVRRAYQKMRYEKCAITIQRYFRGYMVRRERVKYIRKVIKVQCCVRRWLAKRRLREARIEARSVGHLQKLNKGLENKIIELQIKLDHSNHELIRLPILENEKRSVESKLTDQLRISETEKRRLEVVLADLRREMELLGADLSNLQGERPNLLKARDRMLELEMEVDRLQVELEVREGEKIEAESRCQVAESKLAQCRAEYEQQLSTLRDQYSELKTRTESAEKERDSLNIKLRTEIFQKEKFESDLTTMRKQLVDNANLLASGALGKFENKKESKTSSANGNDVTEIALIMSQQKMISELRSRSERMERDNERLRSVIHSENLLESLDKRPSLKAADQLRQQELEAMNSRLRQEIDRLVEEKLPNDYKARDMIDRLMEENEKLRDEATELRALLSNQPASSSPRPDSGHWSAGHSESGSDAESRGRLEQRTDLDRELCVERQFRWFKRHIEWLERVHIERNIEIEKLEQRLQRNEIQRHPDGSIDSLRSQMGELVAENLDMTDKFNRQADELSEIRAQLRGYAGDCEAGTASDSEIVRVEAIGRRNSEIHSARLHVYNVPEFSKILISDLKPRLAKHLTPCFPAYLLLTAFRYYDEQQDETGLTPLFSAIHIVLKDTISHTQDMEILSLWLVNTWRLYHLLNQYGEIDNVEWQAGNTETQNAQRIRNLDLNPLRQQMAARADECYQTLMKKTIEPLLKQKTIPGVLLHESPMWEMLTGKQSDGRHAKALDDLLDYFTIIHQKLLGFGGDEILIEQIFRRLAEWTCSMSLNHMMFRKDLCRAERAIQIKHNVQEIQNWLGKHNMRSLEYTMDPLVQASHLLQSKKDESNVETLCGEMTSVLLPKQILCILQHYTPSEGFEESVVSPELLDRMEKRLMERSAANGQDTNKLIMPGTYLPPLDMGKFVPCDVKLETLSLPSPLRLHEVCRFV